MKAVGFKLHIYKSLKQGSELTNEKDAEVIALTKDQVKHSITTRSYPKEDKNYLSQRTGKGE